MPAPCPASSNAACWGYFFSQLSKKTSGLAGKGLSCSSRMMNKWMTSTCNLFQIAAVKRCEVASLLPKDDKEGEERGSSARLGFPHQKHTQLPSGIPEISLYSQLTAANETGFIKKPFLCRLGSITTFILSCRVFGFTAFLRPSGFYMSRICILGFCHLGLLIGSQGITRI